MAGRGQANAPTPSVFAPRRAGAPPAQGQTSAAPTTGATALGQAQGQGQGQGHSGQSRGVQMATAGPVGTSASLGFRGLQAGPAGVQQQQQQQQIPYNAQTTGQGHVQSRMQQQQLPLHFGNQGKRAAGTTGSFAPVGQQQQTQQQHAQPVQGAQEGELDEDLGLSDIQVREITKVFGIFDLDKNGLIDQSEFLLACQAIDIPISKGEATELMQHWGIERPRTTVTNVPLRPKYFLSEDSFFSIVGPRVSQRDPGEDAARAFAYIDVEGKGFINHADLRRVAERVATIDQTIEDAEIAAMLEAADLDGDGIITSEEFFDIAFD